MAAKNIKIFIASAGEVKAEREKAILMLNHLSKSHRHLQLEPVEWEYDIVPGSQSGSETIQHSINPKLRESDLLVFIFYSRIGQYTRQEFELATAENKKFFAFFKSGFSPANKTEHEQYGELLDFKDGLSRTVLHVPYKDADGFGSLFYLSINQYLAESHPTAGDANDTILLPAEVNTLIRLLGEKEERIKQLEGLLPAAASDNEAKLLSVEIADIRDQLIQSEALRQQQAKDKAELEQQLRTQKDKDSLKAQALHAVEKGDYATAEKLLQERAKESIDDAAATFFELAKLKNLQLQYRQAYSNYKQAAKLNPTNSLYLNDTGVMARQLGDTDAAINYYQKSLLLVIQEYGERHPEIAIRYNNLGVVYRKKGEYDKAIDYYKKALVIDKEFYGERHPDIAIDYSSLGAAYYSKGDHIKAIDYYEQALSISEEFYGIRHLDVAIYYNNLGLVYDNIGEYDKAIGYYEKALDIGKEVYGGRHPKIAIRYNNLGGAFYRKCNYDKAIRYYEQALDIDKEFYGDEHLDIAMDYNNLGGAYDSKNEYEKAIDYYKIALTIFEASLPPGHPSIAITKENLQSAKESKAGKI